MELTTKFDIHQRVRITELEVEGRVKAIYFNNYVQYLIRYFDKAEAHEHYFYEDEIKALEYEEEDKWKN